MIHERAEYLHTSAIRFVVALGGTCGQARLCGAEPSDRFICNNRGSRKNGGIIQNCGRWERRPGTTFTATNEARYAARSPVNRSRRSRSFHKPVPAYIALSGLPICSSPWINPSCEETGLVKSSFQVGVPLISRDTQETCSCEKTPRSNHHRPTQTSVSPIPSITYHTCVRLPANFGGLSRPR